MTPAAEKQEVVVCQLGQVQYEPAWRLQKRIQAELIAAKREDPPRAVPHVMLAVEHPPVYTLGKSGDARHLLVSEALLAQQGATFIHIDRGGDITFHGPGQLVGYPILDLDRVCRDVHLYLRKLEEAGIRTCADFGISAGTVDGKTGVWIDAENETTARKICAMGIRCSRWVSMHGFAFNVNTDLKYFDNIVPCGIVNREVTTLAKELGTAVNMDEVLNTWLKHFAAVFDVSYRMLDGQQSLAFLEDFLGESLAAYELAEVL
ncbi:MAG: lipoyl(octanoyl) transferase LipB [Bacteroidota bacterium]